MHVVKNGVSCVCRSTPHVLKKLVPRKLKNQLVFKAQRIPLVNEIGRRLHAQDAVRQIRRQSRDRAVEGVAGARITVWLHRFQAVQSRL